MSKADVIFTIGADGSAFAGALKKLHDPLSKIGEAFIGLQGVTAGLKTVFGGLLGCADALTASLQRFLMLNFKCWMLNLC